MCATPFALTGKAMSGFAQMRNLELWYSHLSAEQAFAQFTAGVEPKRLKQAEANIERSRTKDSMQAFDKLTHLVEGEPRIISDPPLIVPIDELLPTQAERDEIQDEIRTLVRSYRRTLGTDRRHLLEQFRFVDLARKVVGVGSVGTRAWIALFLGIDDRDPLFLQIKEAQPSVLERFVGKSEYINCGQRVVAGQRLMQATSDIFLGWQHVSSGIDGKAHDSYVRQLKDWKGSFSLRSCGPRRRGRIRERLRVDARPRSRTLGGQGCDRRLPRQVRRVRSGNRGLRRDLRRAKRKGLPRVRGCRCVRPDQGRERPLNGGGSS